MDNTSDKTASFAQKMISIAEESSKTESELNMQLQIAEIDKKVSELIHQKSYLEI
jgi:hypothetical protein